MCLSFDHNQNGRSEFVFKRLTAFALAGLLASTAWEAIGLARAGSHDASAIELTSVPAYGSSDLLYGHVTEAHPEDYAVAVYIHVPPYGWWTKPSYAAPLTTIDASGSWSCDIVTGGQDIYATKVAAFLVPDTCTPPQAGGQQCLPEVLYTYPYGEVLRYDSIEFAGCDWLIKRAHDQVGPGPNFFSSSDENVWVDDDGRLHLRVAQRTGQWYCSELIADRNLGYGRYAFTIRAGIDTLNPNVVLGCFTWEDCAAEYNYREIDIEISQWGDPGDNNAQFVVQPWDSPGNRHRFDVFPAGDPNGVTTHEFIWDANEIQFRSYFGGFALNPAPADIIDSWLYAGDTVPPAGNENLRLNLWLMNGEAPTDGLDAEVVVDGVKYFPCDPNGVYRFWSPLHSKHFYTTSETERDYLLATYSSDIWTYEGTTYRTIAEDRHTLLAPVFRFWSPMHSAHFYTISEAERDYVMTTYDPSTWTYEGVVFYAYPEGAQPPGTRPVYRFWSDSLDGHFYTIDQAERDYVIANLPAWQYETVAWYAYE